MINFYRFALLLIINYNLQAFADFTNEESSNSLDVQSQNFKFQTYCDDIAFKHNDILNSKSSNLSVDETEVINAFNICSSSNNIFSRALEYCNRLSGSDTCDYVLSLDQSTSSDANYNRKNSGSSITLPTFPKLTRCEEAANSIIGICKKKDPSLENTLMSITKQSASMIANTSAIDTCSNLARTAAAIESSLSATGFACASQVDTCNQSCQEASQEIQQAHSQSSLTNISELDARLNLARKECQKGQVIKQELDQGVSQALHQVNTSAQCRNRLSSDIKLPSYAECKASPNLKGCEFFTGLSQDCSQPQVAATNLTCICQANPTDNRCRTQLKAQSLDGGLGVDPSRSARLKADESGGLAINPYGGQDEVMLPTGNNDAPTGFQLSNNQGAPGGGGGGSLGESLNSPYQKPQAGGDLKSKIDPNVIGRAGGVTLPPTEIGKMFKPGYFNSIDRKIAAEQLPKSFKEKVKDKWEDLNLERFIPNRHSFKRLTNYLTNRDPYQIRYLNLVDPRICGPTCPLNMVLTVTGPDAITGPDVDLFSKNSRAMIIHHHNPQELNPLLTPEVIETIKEQGVVFKIPRPKKLTREEMQERYHFPSEVKPLN